ncbi:hypothetical protein NHQ30_011142 [Ciborinia camelliae]|nr:hypothetical protein NHQ30_011142 [Ciborinia camelliae]
MSTRLVSSWLRERAERNMVTENDRHSSSPSGLSGTDSSISGCEEKEEEEDNDDNDSMAGVETENETENETDMETDNAEEMANQLEPVSDDTDDEVEEMIERFCVKTSQKLNLRFREAVKKSTLKRIESLIVEGEELKSEVRKLRGVIDSAQVLLEEVEGGGLNARDKDTWLEACRNSLRNVRREGAYQT